MTIVAKNSLTLSNVNDGTITHVAYAYSADGTDRFTTVYPNLNLIDGTSKNFKNQTIIPGRNWTVLYSPLTIFAGKTITISVFFDLTNVIYDAYIKSFSTVGQANGNVIKAGTKGFSSVTTTISTDVTSNSNIAIYISSSVTSNTNIPYSSLKVEFGSTETPWMPSASEVTTADWPSYIGQYSDFTSTASTDPTKYAPWTVFKGNDGKDGAIGPQGPQGNTGPQGPTGPAGSNGDPGKIVSDAEPTTKFKGLTWKYSGITAINASDGTSIQPSTEYYWNGNNWVLNQINAHNINVDDLSAISTTLTNGKFISNWSSSNATGTTTIEKNHLIINSANASLNTNNTIALDNEQGMMMTYTDTTNNRTISAGVNFQGLFVTDSTGPYVSVTPTGIVNSVDVSWTTIGSYAAYRRDGRVVTIRVVGAKTSTTGNINIGSIPLKDCPAASVMGDAIAWSASVTNDKHIQINGLNQQNSGTVTILSAAANQEYTFQFTYQI